MTQSYTEVFGGTNIYPSDVSYLEFSLTTSDIVLAWPVETNAPNALADYVAARIMDVNCTGSSRKIFMPDATAASVGECFLYNNIGTIAFTIVDSTGGVICSVAPGTLWQIYMTDNTTAAGVWVSYQFGSTTSTANAGALAGFGLKAITTTLNQAISVLTLNSNYTAGVSDRAHMINWTGGTGTISFTSAVTLGADWFIYLRNSGSSAITVDPYGVQTIDSATTLALNPGESAMIITDGVNLFTVGLGKSAIFTFDYTSINVAGSGNYTLSGFQLNRISYNLTGALTGNRVIIVPTTIQQYWITNNTTGSYTLTVKTAAGTGPTVPQGGASILYCDGTNVVQAQTLSINIPVPITDGGTGATSAGGALINLGGTSVGTAVFTASDSAAARTAIDTFSTTDSLSYIVAFS
ncbi:hypothetical protein UFOVP122_56 [uncultured Caudovirales phage]|uniref:Uncharacterized protein n=1 Tax=uncultured Caudovirales phage TaxID=2100421 RepID=A0A6J5LD65_9CAUD|nr:hypothetical protein UFOVP122_56 [uncultured Caudovirales phage]